MNTLSFHELPSGKFESDVFQFGDDAALELNFESVPKFVGVDIAICQSLSQENWQTCYYEQQYLYNTFCKSVQGASRQAYFKIITTFQPVSAYYI